MAKSNFIVRGGADFSQLHSELNKTQGQIKGFGNNINKTLNGMGLSFATLGKAALIGLAIKGLYRFGKAAIDVASDLVEVQNVVDTTFGSMASDVNDFADVAIKQFGLSELSAKKYASTMGAMLKSSGISGTVAKDMSIDLAKLSADMASFYNLDNDVAFDKIMSGMSGMTMPLKELGINMNIANLEAYAMSQGIKKSWEKMSQAEQTMIRYNYLLKTTGDSQGDFAKNAGSWANQIKILSENWKQFMGLIGTALMEFALPFVKALNKLLEFLIAVTKEIGKIYTLLTGKEVKVVSEVNNDLADSAGDAADSEKDLGKGIDKAAKAARKALAPFDELNILQKDMQDNNKGGGGGGLLGLDNPTQGGKGNVSTTIETGKGGDPWKIPPIILPPIPKFPDPVWRPNWGLEGLPKTLPFPIVAPVPSPVWNPNWGLDGLPKWIPIPSFEPLPNPIWQPNWGLEIPKVGQPVFNPIPSPVYNPNWGLELPKIPIPIFPAIEYGEYTKSLEAIKLASIMAQSVMQTESARIRQQISQGISSTLQGIETNYNKHKTTVGSIVTTLGLAIEAERVKTAQKVTTGIATTLTAIETSYNSHKTNVGVVATAISTVLVANINQGLTKVATNINNTITTTQNNLQTWGKNVGSIAAETAKSYAANVAEGLKATAQNTINFANGHLANMKAWGTGVLQVAGETAKGFASNMASGFSSTWNSFKSLMSGMGEKVKGFFSENKGLVIKSAIAGAVVLGGLALALTVPAAIPYMAGALGGLAAVPALAKGGITNGPMMAMIGDNPGGKEVVSPLNDLMGMIQTAVNTTNSSNGETSIVVKIGEDTIVDRVVSSINRQSRISGKTIITV